MVFRGFVYGFEIEHNLEWVSKQLFLLIIILMVIFTGNKLPQHMYRSKEDQELGSLYDNELPRLSQSF